MIKFFIPIVLFFGFWAGAKVESQFEISLQKMLLNISPSDSVPGVVIASPSRQDPDYYFHWIRDSALVITSLVRLDNQGHSVPEFERHLQDFINFSRKVQLAYAPTGLGEPRFNVDGTAFLGPWARPQNDGPALRVLTLLGMLEYFPKETDERKKIGEIIETDIHYLLKEWTIPSYDLWEEIRGQHFYTRVVQLEALRRAGALAASEKWNFSAEDCVQATRGLETELEKHWQPEKSYFAATRDRLDGGDNKSTDLDVAVVLGSLHSEKPDGVFSILDDRIISTAFHLERTMQNLYAINLPEHPEVAPAIGRYSDDVYFGGNPWYLTTAAYAELHFRLAKRVPQIDSFVVTPLNRDFLQNALRAARNKIELKLGEDLIANPALLKTVSAALTTRGHQFMERIRQYTPEGGGMAEQFGRDHGRPVSARDLTWSYAAFITAVLAQE